MAKLRFGNVISAARQGLLGQPVAIDGGPVFRRSALRPMAAW